MPQTLHRFGVDPANPSNPTNTPTAILTASKIAIYWASWCDLIYREVDLAGRQTVAYSGTSLNVAQQKQFTCPDAYLNAPIRDSHLSFFGSTMHDGVRGFVLGHTIGIFHTPAEKATSGGDHREFGTHRMPPEPSLPLGEVRMCSDGSLLLAAGNDAALLATNFGPVEHKPEPKDDRTPNIGSVKDIQGLKEYCSLAAGTETLAPFMPSQLIVNATTATALDNNGRVHTRTTDPRYPACLGRPHVGTSTFELVPYLSETRITKIASGGYMSAAISEDGELFLWGQSNPGIEGELGVLATLDPRFDAAPKKETGIWSDIVQDEDVKCTNIYIDGNDAIAYDVAIGFGHILVAAKDNDGQRAVFSAGCGSEGQLGLGRMIDFLGEFEEAVGLRGKSIMQLEAAGWSSYVVTEDIDLI